MLILCVSVVFSSDVISEISDSTEQALVKQLEENHRNPDLLTQINKLMISCLDEDPARAISLGLIALDLTLNSKESNFLADIHNTIASAFVRKELLGIALDYYDNAFEIFTQLNHKSGMAWNYISIGNVYFKQEYFDLAAQKYFESTILFEELADSNGLAVSFSNLGLIKFKLGDFKRAEDYMLNAVKLRTFDPMPYRKAQIRFPLVELYLETGNLIVAEEFLKEAQEFCDKGCGKEIQSNFHFLSGMLGMKYEQFETAEIHYYDMLSIGNTSAKIKALHELISLYQLQNRLNEAIEMSYKLLELAEQNDFLNLNAEALQILGNLFIEKGDSERALDLLNQAITIVNDIREENVTEVTTRTEVSRKVRSWEKKFIAKNREIENQKISRNNWVISTVGLILFIIFLSKYYMNNQQHQLLIQNQKEEIHNQEITIQNQENERLNRELIHKKNELTSKSLFLAEKQKSLEEIKQKLFGLKKNVKFRNNGELKNVMNIIEKQLTDIDPWEEFHINLTELYPDFLEKLNEKFPELNNNDHRLCGLLKLGFNSKQIAEIRNISLRGVEQHRYRLRKKMDLAKDEKLPDILQII